MSRLPGELGSGQAAVLASIIRRAGNGPAHIADIQADTGLRRSTIRQHLARLDALDLVHPWLDRDHITPLVRPYSIEQAAATSPTKETS